MLGRSSVAVQFHKTIVTFPAVAGTRMHMSAFIDIADASDSRLVERCLADRDSDAFAALVERYQNLVCSVAFAIVGDHGQSEDVAQEAFVTAYRRLPTLREPDKFKSWLCGIARHRALAVVRKRKPESAFPDGPCALSPDDAPDAAAASRDEEALVRRAIAGLPESYREPLVLFYREDQSVARVAAGLDLSEDAVKQRLSRGRKMLRERVLSMIESTLEHTRPGRTFTLAVMGALPGVLAGSAAAAGTGAGSVGKAVAAGTAGAAAGGAIMGTLGGLFGGLLGFFASHQTARYASQRALIKRCGLIALGILAVFLIPWIAMGLGWWHPRDLPPRLYLSLYFFWMSGFFLAFGIWAWRLGVQSRRLRKQSERSGEKELPPTPLRRELQRREGRRWESRARFLGWPLVSVAFADPDRDFAGYEKGDNRAQRTAKGWIAIGDKAVGLVACGNIALGGIAFGAASCGVVSFGGVASGGLAFGGVSLGLVAIGGLALGWGAIGGAALGWLAVGGGAVAWKAAQGGFACARDFAAGGEAIAREANTSAAETFIESSRFFEIAHGCLSAMQNPWMVGAYCLAVFGAIAGMMAIGYRKRRD